MTAHTIASHNGYLRLCRAQIYAAIEDLHDKKHNKSALTFFLSDNFRLCCKACGFNYRSIIDVVYEMSKLNTIQKKVRGQQLIKELRGQNVSSSRGGSRKAN